MIAAEAAALERRAELQHAGRARHAPHHAALIRPASKRDPVVTEEIEVALVHINNPTGHSQQLSSSIMGIAGDSCAFRAAATIVYQIALLSDADLLVVAGTSLGGTAAQHVAARQDDRGVYNR